MIRFSPKSQEKEEKKYKKMKNYIKVTLSNLQKEKDGQ